MARWYSLTYCVVDFLSAWKLCGVQTSGVLIYKLSRRLPGISVNVPILQQGCPSDINTLPLLINGGSGSNAFSKVLGLTGDNPVERLFHPSSPDRSLGTPKWPVQKNCQKELRHGWKRMNGRFNRRALSQTKDFSLFLQQRGLNQNPCFTHDTCYIFIL